MGRNRIGIRCAFPFQQSFATRYAADSKVVVRDLAQLQKRACACFGIIAKPASESLTDFLITSGKGLSREVRVEFCAADYRWGASPAFEQENEMGGTDRTTRAESNASLAARLKSSAGRRFNWFGKSIWIAKLYAR
jgi:hypothetical protein